MRAPTIRHHATAICAVLLALVATAPASAQGQRCQAPPGRSALEQYCERLPGAGGQQGGGGGGERLNRKTTRELRSAGDEGAALLGLAESSGGGSGDGSGSGGAGGGGSGSGDAGGSANGASGSGSSGSGAGGAAESEPSGSVLSALASSAEEGPTVGGALAWVLIAVAIGCFGLAWVTWRRRRGDEPESSA